MLQEKILKEAHIFVKISHKLLNISWRIQCSKRRFLWSPMPNEHPANIQMAILDDWTWCKVVWCHLNQWQNIAVGILTDIRKYIHTCISSILHELGWFTVKELLRLWDTTMIYKCLNVLTPSFLSWKLTDCANLKRMSTALEIEINLAFPNVAQQLLSASFFKGQ